MSSSVSFPFNLSWLLFLGRPPLAFSSEFTRLEEWPGAKPPFLRRRLLHNERRLLRIEVIRREKVLLQCNQYSLVQFKRVLFYWKVDQV